MEATGRIRVLIVDDEARVADAMSRVLSDSCDVQIATRPRDAVERILNGAFDVVLCDVLMPEMLGVDVHAAVSRLRPDLATRMIFMTGGVLPLRARDFLARVGNVCFEKPIEADRLRALVRDHAEPRIGDTKHGTGSPPSSHPMH